MLIVMAQVCYKKRFAFFFFFFLYINICIFFIRCASTIPLYLCSISVEEKEAAYADLRAPLSEIGAELKSSSTIAKQATILEQALDAEHSKMTNMLMQRLEKENVK